MYYIFLVSHHWSDCWKSPVMFWDDRIFIFYLVNFIYIFFIIARLRSYRNTIIVHYRLHGTCCNADTVKLKLQGCHEIFSLISISHNSILHIVTYMPYDLPLNYYIFHKIDFCLVYRCIPEKTRLGFYPVLSLGSLKKDRRFKENV